MQHTITAMALSAQQSWAVPGRWPSVLHSWNTQRSFRRTPWQRLPSGLQRSGASAPVPCRYVSPAAGSCAPALQILWAFCVYLEAVSVLPQLRMMQKAKVCDRQPQWLGQPFPTGSQRPRSDGKS